jgi:hypothetical protein
MGQQGEWTEWTPDCALSFKTPDVAPSSKLRKAMSGKPGGYVGQAVDMSGLSGGGTMKRLTCKGVG